MDRPAFTTAPRILFGLGVSRHAGRLTVQPGQRVFLVTGHTPARADFLRAQLEQAGCPVRVFSLDHEPSTATAEMALHDARSSRAQAVAAVGGGSVIDLAKAVSALLTNPGSLSDYLEVIGEGRPIERRAAPLTAIPTTAGTGAEVTRNAVLTSTEHRVKVSMRSPLMIPSTAVVDPLLTLSLPRDVTAATGMDALAQVLEPFLSRRAGPVTDGLCRMGIRLASRALVRTANHPDDLAARSDMCKASLFGGLALANAGLGAVHGFAGPLGGMYDAPHGALCAALLAPVFSVNARHLASGDPTSQQLERFREAAVLLTGNPNAGPEDGARFLDNLRTELDIPPLAVYGISRKDYSAILPRARASSSMKGNPAELSDEELAGILDQAL